MKVYWHPGLEPDRFLTRLFNAWNHTLKAYERALGNAGLPYIYGERANVGHLALAARDIGAFPWIEAPASEGGGNPDLYVERPGREAYLFEVKWIDPSRTVNKDPTEVSDLIKVRLSEAKRAARRRSRAEADIFIGIVFVPLALHEDHVGDFRPNTWRTLAEKLVKARGGPDFAVVHLYSREIWSTGQHYCPGVLLLGSYARPRSYLEAPAS
jgi:hypothetical protein